jgi:hypothetical protein
MNIMVPTAEIERYARCILSSKKVRWEIDRDVIRGRRFSRAEKYLPDGLSLTPQFHTLSDDEKFFVSQIQGRTYANVFGLVERFINAKVLEISSDYVLGDQIALEALIRFSDEELKHQALFRRVNDMIGEVLPDGYKFTADPDAVAGAVLGKSTWSVLALTLDIELFTQLHYRTSIDPDVALSDLFKDIFLYHWKEESQHAILDELELRRHHKKLTEKERDQGVDDFIALVGAVDGILKAQAEADTEYFAAACGRDISAHEAVLIEGQFLKAYRWQYIHSGAAHPTFQKVLSELITEEQGAKIADALSTLH